MKIQLSFRYFPKGHTEIGSSIPFQITIDEANIDMNHYDGIWDFWFGENENELLDKGYVPIPDDEERVFEVLGDKKFISGKEIISGENLSVSIYENNGEDDWFEHLDENDIEVKFL